MKDINIPILDSKVESDFFVSTKSNIIKNDSKDFSNCLKQAQNDIQDGHKVKSEANSKFQYKKAISSKTVTKGKNEKISTGDLEEDVENISPLSDKLKSVNSQIQNLILQLLELYTNYDENNENEVKESIEQFKNTVEEAKLILNDDFNPMDKIEFESLEDIIDELENIVEKLENKFNDVLDVKTNENLKNNILALQKEIKTAFENTLSKENTKEISEEMNIETIKKDSEVGTKDVFFSNQKLEENVEENTVAEIETKGEENLLEEDLDEKSTESNEIREEPLLANSKIKTNFEGKIEAIQKKEIEMPKDEIIKQVLDKGKAILDENKSEIRIKLKPEVLGEVLLKVEVEKGVVVAKAMVDNYRVKELLEANIYQLKEGLEEQGLDIKTFEVQVGTNSNFENQKREKYSSNGKNKKIKIKKLDLSNLSTYEENNVFNNENITQEGSLDLMA